MIHKPFRITGVGCALADFLYTNVQFHSQGFRNYHSKTSGDGGLSPGKLVFTEELEHFGGKPYSNILKEIIGNTKPDSFNIGGPALVSLIHAAQLLPTAQFETAYYGCVGNDTTGKQIFEMLQKTPLNTKNYITVDGAATANTDVLSDTGYDNGQGERTFINNIGASWSYTPALMPHTFFDARIVCFGGTSLVPTIHDHLTSLLQKAKTLGCATVVNTVYDFRNEKKNPNKPWPLGNSEQSFPLIDLLIMDAEEALKISGQSNLNDAGNFFCKNVKSFIITNGSKDLMVCSKGGIFNELPLATYPVCSHVLTTLANNPELKGDTTGCGDNFAGGIIASLAMQMQAADNERYSLEEALCWGVASGGFACFYKGGTYFEQLASEKLQKVTFYRNKYIEQIG